MKTILAIGGAVIKTAYDEIKECAQKKKFDVLIHNGGSLFHDFQRATEELEGHSYSLEEILKDKNILAEASSYVWAYLAGGSSPKGSLTRICQDRGILVLMFTGLGCDFWQLFHTTKWELITNECRFSFVCLTAAMEKPFHYICMGSAVIHPEVFTKALVVAKPKECRTTVVDFLPDQYRPKTRVAKYGRYLCMTHKEYLTRWLKSDLIAL